MESFGFFVTFGINLRPFSFGKKAIIFSEKPTTQQLRAMLSVLNILINEVCRKFDKNCLKLVKIRKFWNFRQFWGQFSGTKSHLSLHRRLLENEFSTFLFAVPLEKMTKFA